MVPHESNDVIRQRVNVTLHDKKVGTAFISGNGTLSVLITDPKIAELLDQNREIQHISIDPTYKK